MKSILAIGHTTFDTFLKVDNSDFTVDSQTHNICFNLGSKMFSPDLLKEQYLQIINS